MGYYTGKKVGLGLSGGINSAAVLCWMIEQGEQPLELHLYYAHFKEHSPDTFKFVVALIRYARLHFKNVIVKITRHSVLEFFLQEKMIPHPKVSPCTKKLKIEPMELYFFENNITVDLIGYIRSEKRRMDNQAKKRLPSLFLEKTFPIQCFDDNWCFEIVMKHIGWYPKIYTIVDAEGKRLFKHNNCLPCKEMGIEDMKNVDRYYPAYMQAAKKLSAQLQAYWGRSENDYYTEFGRQDYDSSLCATCSFA